MRSVAPGSACWRATASAAIECSSALFGATRPTASHTLPRRPAALSGLVSGVRVAVASSLQRGRRRHHGGGGKARFGQMGLVVRRVGDGQRRARREHGEVFTCSAFSALGPGGGPTAR